MKIVLFAFFSAILLVLIGCDEELTSPTVILNEIDSVTNTTAIGRGLISNTGGAKIVVHGICWDTTPNPTIDLMTITTSFEEEREFSHKLTGLIKNTTYYVKAYAKSSTGTSYSDVFTFTSYNATEVSGSVLALPSDVLLVNGEIVEFIGDYFGPPRITWGPIDNPVSWKVNYSGVLPGSGRFLAYVAGVEIYFPGSVPPSQSKVYQLKPNNTNLNLDEASISYYSNTVTNDPNVLPYSYRGWSANGTMEVIVIRGEVNIVFSNVVIDSNIVSANLKLR